MGFFGRSPACFGSAFVWGGIHLEGSAGLVRCILHRLGQDLALMVGNRKYREDAIVLWGGSHRIVGLYSLTVVRAFWDHWVVE